MAARKQRWHDQATREKIQAGLLVTTLTKHVAGELKLSATQVTAALGLLRKCVPDLASVQHQGDENNPVVVTRIEHVIVEPRSFASSQAPEHDPLH
jgi:hypothetical protein